VPWECAMSLEEGVGGGAGYVNQCNPKKCDKNCNVKVRQ